ncbi:MAG: bifunctional isocitrate dehydrogenase kinase/phosphatase [Dokdonella sp.]
MTQPNASEHSVVPDAATRAAALILDAFLDYNERFADITRRAKRHFERRDWRAAQVDGGTRIDLYDVCVAETLARLELLLDDRVRSRPLWASIRDDFAGRVEPLLDRELTKTFFNTLSRRFFRTRGVDAGIEFIALDDEPTAGIAEPALLKRHEIDGDLAATCAGMLADYPFANGYADRVRDASAIAREIAERAFEEGIALHAIDLLRNVFYRERRAYLVGRLVDGDDGTPLVIVLVSTAEGVRADAVLTNTDQVSLLFGYARNAFQADLPTVGDTVLLLEHLMPHKPVGEIYSVLGRLKQGKTERYRHLFRHLGRHPQERLVHADGERGMVMAVFTPKDYPIVVKIIRDHFAYPKDIARRQVEEKYRLVFRYDRVGRLVDAQEFHDLHFPLQQFETSLLQELTVECAESVTIAGDHLVVRHCYIERRLRPLNLYAREAAPDAARRAVLDYGQAIKDLARSNIFPGDLLLKNFGVSRIGRAIFYDYDELCLVEQCRFRRLPDAREGDETRPLEDWLSVRENDVFPEQFPRFLGIPDALRDALLATHPEIFDPVWWNALRERLLAGEQEDVPPYPASARLAD